MSSVDDIWIVKHFKANAYWYDSETSMGQQEVEEWFLTRILEGWDISAFNTDDFGRVYEWILNKPGRTSLMSESWNVRLVRGTPNAAQ